MTTWAIWIFATAVYVAGWWVTAVKATRVLWARGACHHEDRMGGRDSYNNGSRSWCARFHRSECWRTTETPTLLQLAGGVLVAVPWLIVVVGWSILRQATSTVPKSVTDRRIEALEREVGIQ